MTQVSQVIAKRYSPGKTAAVIVGLLLGAALVAGVSALIVTHIHSNVEP